MIPSAKDVPGATDRLAVMSLVLGILPTCSGLPAVILGIMALRRVRQSGQKGRFYAIGGIVAGSFWIAALVLLLVVGYHPPKATRDASGHIVAAGRVTVNSLMTGDCLKEWTKGTPARELTGVPCSEPHMAEVIIQFPLSLRPSTPFLDPEPCAYSQKKYASSALNDGVYVLYGSQGRNRTVICLLLHKTARTGSVQEE